jgi:hypothetical protein
VELAVRLMVEALQSLARGQLRLLGVSLVCQSATLETERSILESRCSSRSETRK